METKLFEIRDSATFIPVLAVRLNPTGEEERYLLARSGYGQTPQAQGEYVVLCRIDGGIGKVTCDPVDWGNNPRTMWIAHEHIQKNWSNLTSGDVVDVEHILRETAEKKKSERLTVW